MAHSLCPLSIRAKLVNHMCVGELKLQTGQSIHADSCPVPKVFTGLMAMWKSINLDGQACVCCLPGKEMTPGCTMGLSSHICTRIKYLLTIYMQRVKLGPHIFLSITLSTETPQGCVLGPLLYFFYTHDCTQSSSQVPSSNLPKIQLF